MVPPGFIAYCDLTVKTNILSDNGPTFCQLALPEKNLSSSSLDIFNRSYTINVRLSEIIKLLFSAIFYIKLSKIIDYKATNVNLILLNPHSGISQFGN